MFRQNRSLEYCAGTLMSVVPALTTNNCPVSAFCGRPPSPGGLNRGSSQVPVQVGGSCGSTDAVVVGLLVTDQGAVRGAAAVDARLAPGLPEHLVAAEERQVHAGVAGRLDVGPLRAGPVLVVPGRHEHLVVGQQRPAGRGPTSIPARVGRRRSRSPPGTGSSDTRRTSASCGRRCRRPRCGTAGCRTPSRRPCTHPGFRAGSSTRTCRGCCRRRCCRPATSRRRSGR